MGVMHSWELEVVKVLSVDAKIYIFLIFFTSNQISIKPKSALKYTGRIPKKR